MNQIERRTGRHRFSFQVTNLDTSQWVVVVEVNQNAEFFRGYSPDRSGLPG